MTAPGTVLPDDDFYFNDSVDKDFNLTPFTIIPIATSTGLSPVCDDYNAGQSAANTYKLNLISPATATITDIEASNPDSMSFNPDTLVLTLSGTNSYNAD